MEAPSVPSMPGMQGGKKILTQNILRMKMRKAGHLAGKEHIANLIASQGVTGINLDEQYAKMIEKYDSS